ncbi:predicted protein [Nematostella vectensis]|uniref:GDP-D-glucose phosphorylase 1 n=1 Tax=Nematostella vectensis TaxID=45351 RepID=A7SA65_NEMVE|nr:GDP-D-glucose phosphorylase 1 [Nematostella vectensis]EDO39439.1 predicted protein [Nematostella vectensis]|eukprot:XP_001631502.1 predicted protein [Nematostella vectensis]
MADGTNRTNGTSSFDFPKFTYDKKDFVMDCQSWKVKPQNFKLSKFDNLLRTSWTQAMADGCFKYTLDSMETKLVPGKFGVVAQLNEKRFVERRKPQQITSVSQPYDPGKFNFTKVQDKEILFEVCPSDQNSSPPNYMIINVSPLEFGNCLLVPSVFDQTPQILTVDSLKLAFDIAFLSSHRGFHIGYNSLCAFASVNHLHFHVWYLDYPSPLETLPTKHVHKDMYEVTNFPTKIFVFYLSSAADVERIARQVHAVTSYFVSNEIAHNLSICRGLGQGSDADSSAVRVYLWPRKPVIGAKDETGFNIAVCEMGGHLPIRTRTFFESITEQDFIDQLKSVTLEEQEFHRLKEHITHLL